MASQIRSCFPRLPSPTNEQRGGREDLSDAGVAWSHVVHGINTTASSLAGGFFSSSRFGCLPAFASDSPVRLDLLEAGRCDGGDADECRAGE
jgi:hypothetical protein